MERKVFLGNLGWAGAGRIVRDRTDGKLMIGFSMEIGITVNNAIELCAVCQGISSCYKLIIIIYTGSTDS